MAVFAPSTQSVVRAVQPLRHLLTKRSLGAARRGIGRDRRASMAAKASSLGIWVKGDPDNKVLGDCPFCHRVLLTLEEKGLPYEREFIDFAKKPAWLLEVNPAGSVPVMKDGEEWVVDSGVIVEYLEEKYPTPAVPADPEGEEAMAGVFKAFREFLFNKDQAEEKSKESALLSELEKVESLLDTRDGSFFGGEGLNAADASLLPRLYHMKTALGEYKKWSIPDSFPNILTYMARAEIRPSWRNTDYGSAMILKGWGKHFS